MGWKQGKWGALALGQPQGSKRKGLINKVLGVFHLLNLH